MPDVTDIAEVTVPVGTIASWLGLTPRRCQELAKAGVIPRTARGRYELQPAVQGYIRFLREHVDDDEIGGHRKRLLKAKADIAEIEAERLSGAMVPVAEVEAAWHVLAGHFKQRILVIPTRIAPLVAVETEVDACHEIADTFCREALAELAATQIENTPPEEELK